MNVTPHFCDLILGKQLEAITMMQTLVSLESLKNKKQESMMLLGLAFHTQK